MGDAVQDYICEHENWTNQMFNLGKWNTMHHAFKSMGLQDQLKPNNCDIYKNMTTYTTTTCSI